MALDPTKEKDLPSLRVSMGALSDAIHQAFVESRFADPPGARYVHIHADGSVVTSRNMPVARLGDPPVITLQCMGRPEFPGETGRTGITWSHEEFLAWVRSRNDLYLDPSLDELRYLAERQGLRIEFTDQPR